MTRPLTGTEANLRATVLFASWLLLLVGGVLAFGVGGGLLTLGTALLISVIAFNWMDPSP